MDNFNMQLTAETQESLRNAINIAFAHNTPGKTVKSYYVTQLQEKSYEFVKLPDAMLCAPVLVLRWTDAGAYKDDNRPQVLPFNMDAEATTMFVWKWLGQCEYPSEPDHDGDNKKGWFIYADYWGNVANDHYTICAIAPVWAMYGK